MLQQVWRPHRVCDSTGGRAVRDEVGAEEADREPEGPGTVG